MTKEKKSDGVSRRDFIKVAGAGTAAAGLGGTLARADGPGGSGKPINVLFILTEQHRFDALSCAGNSILQTPNIDRLAREGVRFEQANTLCAVCGPARAAILTGHDIFATGTPTNRETSDTDNMPQPSFDNLLSDAGYRGVYIGKWHSSRNPDRLAAYDVMMRGPSLRQMLGEPRPLVEGEQIHRPTGQPYRLDPLDKRYGWAPGEERVQPNGRPVPVLQPDHHGCLDIPEDHSMTVLQAQRTIDALEQMGDQPFSLTCSLVSAHCSVLPAKPYYGMYPESEMPLPETLNDPMINSPYQWDAGRREPRSQTDLVRYMISNYYGLIREIDDWVGKILDTLRRTGLEENTLVVFTSDHGEMLGSHGMREKNVFYEESTRVPLILRLPGRIPAGKVISNPVSLVNLFATILDYTGQPVPPNHGRSLRSLIDGTDTSGWEFSTGEWALHPVSRPGQLTHFGPSFMVRTEEWKFMFGASPDRPSLDGLYNLKEDPLERTNLLGSHPRAKEFIRRGAQAGRMKEMLVSWLERIDSPHTENVKNRPLQAQCRYCGG